MTTLQTTLRVMDARQWRAAAAAHEVRAGRYADPFAQRRARHEVHPVEDFLFTYYTLKPGEWAMAYKSVENNIRHDYLELRLGAEGTDRVVESHRIRCSHFDAFRFFMPQAAPMNELQPTRETQRVLEQPACLHANMDVYKWAYKLLPLVDSTLVMDCFDLAWDARELDMRAAPYEIREWGYEPIPVETAEGKAEYVRIQRELSERSIGLRERLLEVCERYLPPLEA